MLAAILDFRKTDGVTQVYLDFFEALGCYLSENGVKYPGGFLFTQPPLATGVQSENIYLFPLIKYM